MPWERRITPDRAVLIGIILSAAVYCRDLTYDFVLDDVPLILMNDTLASWRNWKTLFTTHIFFTSASRATVFPAQHYRPVYTLWLMLNQQLFGSVTPWWHLTSLLLHVCVVALVYELAQRMLKDQWTAALAALIFAFHPIHVESVSYVSASTDLLVTLFILLAFLAYSRFREADGSPAWLFGSLLAAGLAMLSKETAAIFPWLLVAYEALRERPSDERGAWQGFLWTLPFFVIVGVYTAVRTILFGPNLGPGPGIGRVAALAYAPLVLLVYLRNLVWSFRLSFFYPIEWTWQWAAWKAVVLVIVLSLATFLWIAYRGRPSVRLQISWAAIMFVPALTAVSAFVREDWVHDRHMYLVSVPFCLIAAAILADQRLPRGASMAATSLVLLTLLAQTATQIPRFQDENALYTSTLKVAPRNVLAHRYYASALWNRGDQEAAFREFRISAELSPKDPSIPEAYAGALAEIGRDQEAETQYAAALRLSPLATVHRASLLYRLGTIEAAHQQLADAVTHMREALRIEPQGHGYHAVLAQALGQQGHLQEAEAEMRLETEIQLVSAH